MPSEQLHRRITIPIIPLLRREITNLPKIINPAQQELQLSICRAGRVLWHHVSRKGDRRECEASLGIPLSKDPCACKGTLIELTVVWHVILVPITRPLREALRSVPGHVLDHHDGSILNQDEVEIGVCDDGFAVLLNDSWEDAEAGRWGVICVQHAAGALSPWAYWGVDRLLDICAVEVDGRAFGDVIEGSREAEHVPEERAGGGYLVNVPAWVGEGYGFGDFVEEAAAVVLGGHVGWSGEGPCGREGKGDIGEVRVAALFVLLVEVICESLVEVEET